MQKQFNLSNLSELDGGKANVAITHAIRQIVADINDRPGDKANRKVTIEIIGRPVLADDTAVLDTVNIQIKVKTSVPIRQTREYPMLASKENFLMFSPESPNDPRQQSMFRQNEDGETVNTETGEVLDSDDETQVI